MATREYQNLETNSGIQKEIEDSKSSLNFQRTSSNANQTIPIKITQDGQKKPMSLSLKSLRAAIYLASKALNIVYIPLFIYRVFQSGQKCSEITESVLKIPATELARKIRNKEISSEQVIKTYIARIEEINPLLNAVIEDRFAEALEDARKVDVLLSGDDFQKNAEKYPLLGVPITVKGSIAVKGLRHTSGSVTRKDHRAENDAEVVALIRKAGAIPLLVSNVPELCMSWETTNKLIGTTKNPHDTTRTCGGSSGGEASLLAAGGSILGIGSDVAGSLRLPAHYCGVYGHKPTPGAVSFEGHYPSCQHKDKWENAFTLGPMARYATDLRCLLDVICVPGKGDLLKLNQTIDVKTIKVYYSEHEDYYWQAPNRYCGDAMKKVVNHLRNVCNSTPMKVDFYLSHNMPDLAGFSLLFIEDVEDEFDGNANGVFAELMRYTTLRSKHTFMLIMCGLLRKLAFSCSEKRKAKIKKLLNRVKKEYEDLLGPDGVIIVPTFPCEAPKHGDVLRTAIYSGYLSVFNMLGFPVTNCPVGRTKEGLPVGVQVASRPCGDNLTITVAEELERAFGGWIEPKQVDSKYK